MLIKEYSDLIRNFVDGEISPQQFESQYLKKFKKEKREMPPEVFDIIYYIFTSCDAYCSDPSLRNKYSIDEKELLNDAKDALKKLEKF